MRIVVTGGAGFVGANLVRTLASEEEDHQVVVLDDLSSGSIVNLQGLAGVDFVEGSVLDADLLDRLIGVADAVVHLAARPSVAASVEDPVGTHAHNALGTLRVLEAARQAATPPHTIIASSSAVYGDHPAELKHEELAPRPLSPYAADKLASEAMARSFATCYGVPVLAFRFFNVYGPLQPADHAYAAVIPAFIQRALAGRPLTVHGDGRQTRDFVDVDSVARTIVAALARRVVAEGPVNLAFGTRRTLLDVIAALEAILGRRLPVEHTPPRQGDVRDSRADATRLRSLFPEVVPVAFEEGLSRTLAWWYLAGFGDGYSTSFRLAG